MKLDDRRIAERIPINLKVEYITKDEIAEGFCTDLSKTGIFIESIKPPARTTELRLCFFLPFDDKKIEIRCRGTVERVVDRAQTGTSFTIPGFGIHFREFEGKARDHIAAFIDLKLLQHKIGLTKTKTDTMPSSGDNLPEKSEEKENENISLPTIQIDEELLQQLRLKKKKSASSIKADHKKDLPPQESEHITETKAITSRSHKPQGMDTLKRHSFAEECYSQSLEKYRTGDYEAALELIKQAILFNPNKPIYSRTMQEMEEAYESKKVAILCNEVEEEIKNGQLEQALQKVNHCLACSQDEPKLLRLKAMVLLELNQDLEEALRLANKAFSLNAKDSENHFVLGLIYKKMGDLEKAKTFLQKAVQISKHGDAARELMKLLM
ncbi:PilZ domain-containing protein [bacterium]|nr:PilZ domain-containing protein [bacterium]